jgi:DNA-binding Lrp family transcriptional regulator
MDERDSAFVRLLQRDARQTNRGIARALGIAPSTCLERVRALRARGSSPATTRRSTRAP